MTKETKDTKELTVYEFLQSIAQYHNLEETSGFCIYESEWDKVENLILQREQKAREEILRDILIRMITRLGVKTAEQVIKELENYIGSRLEEEK